MGRRGNSPGAHLFRGAAKLNLDAKGRLAIPARHRDALRDSCESRLVVTVDRDRCLLLYPRPEWLEIERKLTNLPTFNKKVRAIQRLYIGNAQEVEMDAQGRILIPPDLRQFASLDKRVALVGQGNKFEIWSEDVWNEQCEALLDDDDLDELESEAGLGSITI